MTAHAEGGAGTVVKSLISSSPLCFVYYLPRREERMCFPRRPTRSRGQKALVHRSELEQRQDVPLPRSRGLVGIVCVDWSFRSLTSPQKLPRPLDERLDHDGRDLVGDGGTHGGVQRVRELEADVQVDVAPLLRRLILTACDGRHGPPRD